MTSLLFRAAFSKTRPRLCASWVRIFEMVCLADHLLEAEGKRASAAHEEVAELGQAGSTPCFAHALDAEFFPSQHALLAPAAFQDLPLEGFDTVFVPLLCLRIVRSKLGSTITKASSLEFLYALISVRYSRGKKPSSKALLTPQGELPPL